MVQSTTRAIYLPKKGTNVSRSQKEGAQNLGSRALKVAKWDASHQVEIHRTRGASPSLSCLFLYSLGFSPQTGAVPRFHEAQSSHERCCSWRPPWARPSNAVSPRSDPCVRALESHFGAFLWLGVIEVSNWVVSLQHGTHGVALTLVE